MGQLMAASDSKNKRLGKSQARERFLPLVDAVAQGAGPVEITDHNKVVAVLISETDYRWLLAHAEGKPIPSRKLCGSMTIVGDLEQASKEISDLFLDSIKKSAEKL
jgi:prevent-host-death family protein